MAKVFQNTRAGFLNHIYWDDLDDGAKIFDMGGRKKNQGPACALM